MVDWLLQDLVDDRDLSPPLVVFPSGFSVAGLARVTIVLSDELEEEVIMEELLEEWERLERNTTEVVERMMGRMEVRVVNGAGEGEKE